jgi:death-on-curing protein
MPAFQYLGGDYGKGLLESALAQPAQTFGGRFLYRTIFDKAAVLLCSVIKNHSLVDGNKRTALTTMGVFLVVNGYSFEAPTEEAVARCLAIARTEGKVDQREVARWIRSKSLNVYATSLQILKRAEQLMRERPELEQELQPTVMGLRRSLRQVRALRRLIQRLR